jgi:hypothetical protein
VENAGRSHRVCAPWARPGARFALALALAVAGCASGNARAVDAGGTGGGPTADAAPPAVIDAAAPPPTPGQEIVGGGGRLSGGGFTMDVQVGHGVGQAPAVDAGLRLEGGAVVKP